MSSWETGSGQPQATETGATFTTVFRGYDPRQVNDHVAQAAERIKGLEAQAKKLEADLQQARRQTAAFRGAAGKSPYEGVSARVADLVRTFDQDVEKLRADAENEVQRLLLEARAEADRIRLDAQSNAEATREEADRALRAAQEEADTALSELGDRKGALQAELRAIRDRMVEAATELGSVVGPHGADDVVIVEDATAGTTQ